MLSWGICEDVKHYYYCYKSFFKKKTNLKKGVNLLIFKSLINNINNLFGLLALTSVVLAGVAPSMNLVLASLLLRMSKNSLT